MIKIEPPEVPDAIRYWARVLNDMEPFWLVALRNKLPITLNLKHPEAKKILAQLVEKSDILFENMRPGTLDRLGFSAEDLWKINKGLIIGRISGYGQTGPYRGKPASPGFPWARPTGWSWEICWAIPPKRSGNGRPKGPYEN